MRQFAKANTVPLRPPAAIVVADKLNFECRIKGGDDNIRPRRVFDDGAKTYIYRCRLRFSTGRRRSY